MEAFEYGPRSGWDYVKENINPDGSQGKATPDDWNAGRFGDYERWFCLNCNDFFETPDDHRAEVTMSMGRLSPQWRCA